MLVPTKLVELGNALAQGRRYPWQPYERHPQGTVTMNCSVEYLPTKYLTGPKLKWEGELGKNTAQKWQPRQGSSKIHFAKNCRQATANTSHEVPSLKASGHPSIAEKTAGQHCIKANFAQITFSHISSFIQQCEQVGPPLTTRPSSAPTSKKLVVSNGK